MMRARQKVSILLSALCIWAFLLGGPELSTTCAEEHNYFEDPADWMEIVPHSKTVITSKATNGGASIRVSINWAKYRTKSKQTQKICERDNYVIRISVNNENIIMPSSVYCELDDLNRAKVFIEQNNYVLILDGGDASEAYYVKIDFDQKRVLRRQLYVQAITEKTLLSDTKYHIVRM